MKQGHYKLAKQTGRSAHFASVTLTAAPAAVDNVAVTAASDAIRGWGEAVKSGVTEGLKALRAMAGAPPVQVVVTDFLGMPIDTSDDDARTAATLATLGMFLEPSAMPTPQLSED